MISTTCPGCAAKFQVPDELVAGKLVRFRCRKCGGTIAVDGAAPPSAVSAPAPDTSARAARKQTLMMGAPLEKAPPRPDVPGTMLHGVPVGKDKDSVDMSPLSKSEMQAALGTSHPAEKVEERHEPASKPEPAAKFDLERTPSPPSASADDWELPPEPVMAKAKEPDAQPTPAKPAAAKESKPTTPKPAVAKLADPVKAAPSASADKKAETPKPSAAKRPDIFGKGKDAAGPISPKKSEVAKGEGAKGESPKPPASKPSGSDKKLDGPSSKRSARISMELGGVFNAPSRSEKPAKSDDMDVEVDLDVVDEKPLDLEPIIVKPPKPVPPTPQLKKVVLDIGEVGQGDAPESRPMPSVAFFSPVLIPQMQLSQPSAQPLLAAPVEADAQPREKPAAMKSGQGMVWAAIIASAGILCAGGYLLWNTLHSAAPQATRTGASTETPLATQPPTRAATDPTATAPTPPDSVAAATPPAADTAKTAPTDPVAKTIPGDKRDVPPSSTDTGKKVASTQGDPPAATTPAPVETKTPEPPSTTPTKQPQPTEGSDVPFDRSAAATALGARKAIAAGCKQEGGPTGNANVSVTFATSGRVTSANINGPPFAGTPVGGCIASKFRGATVPPFTGSPVTVHTTVPIF